MTAVGPAQRFTRQHPCPVCGGHAYLPQGHGRRCWGFLSSDGEWARCSREEHSDGLLLSSDGMFAHRLSGPCNCGTEHRPAPPQLSHANSNGREHNATARQLAGETIYCIGDFDHVRREYSDGSKNFVWRKHDGTMGLGGRALTDLPLYGAEILCDAAPGSLVIVTEGEKARDALSTHGLLAIGTVTGAKGCPSEASLESLRGYDVVLWPDADEPGLHHMERIAAKLVSMGIASRTFRWSEAPPKGDAADYFELGGSVSDLHVLLSTPVDAVPLTSQRDVDHWPEPLATAAFHGIAGEFLQAVCPYSEADPVALLGHFLAGVGALVGSATHAVAGDAIHPAKLNTVIVGETAKGRKGSAQRPVERLLRAADPDFGSRIMEGLSSGEGLIWAVRDPIWRMERTGRGSDRSTEQVEIDHGVQDKRLLAIESELASVLRSVERDGNILSAIIRRAWDRDDLRTLTKNNPAVATDAHVVIIGHVTKDELLRYLDRTELASGFANRFLWLAVRRGQLLPDGEMVPEGIVSDLAVRLREVKEWAATPRLLARDGEASIIWREVYADLAEGVLGMFGAATSRAEAQVLRLSVTYAILDMSSAIRAEHLKAALAVWNYASDSARWLFGDATGDPTADAILNALRSNGGLTRTQISDLFARNVTRGRIDKALALLLRNNLARSDLRNDTGGRPAQVWSARR